MRRRYGKRRSPRYALRRHPVRRGRRRNSRMVAGRRARSPRSGRIGFRL